MRIITAGLLLMTLWITGCKKDKDSPALSQDKSSITFKAEGGKEYFNITSNTQWTLTGLPEWLTANPSSGTGNSKVELTATANITINELKAALTLKSNSSGVPSGTIAITVEQPQVVISSFTQHAQGGYGIEIEGNGFSEVNSENIVTVNGKPATVSSSRKDKLLVTVPSKAGDGKITVKVNTRTATSASDFYYNWIGTVSTAYDGKTGPLAFYPFDIVSDASDNLYVVDLSYHRVLKIEPGKAPIVLAGSGFQGFVDGKGTGASFRNPANIAIDKSGNLYVSDQGNYAIRKISPEGDVTTIAGRGVMGYDNGSIATATFTNPRGIAVDDNGNIYVSEYYGHTIRKISNGQVSTLAGTGTYGANDGTGTAASFGYPVGMRIDSDDNILLASSYNQKVRKITPAGVVTTVAGTGIMGFSSNLSNLSTFQYLTGVATDTEGNIIVVDRDNNAIRMISKAGWVSTLAGQGSGRYGSTDGTGAGASFDLPEGATVTRNGTIYVTDPTNQKIRKITIE